MTGSPKKPSESRVSIFFADFSRPVFFFLRYWNLNGFHYPVNIPILLFFHGLRSHSPGEGAKENKGGTASPPSSMSTRFL